jgi:DeoR family galactitol utilization operon repressor
VKAKVEQSGREQKILALLAEMGSISVSDLSGRLAVSEVTVRSDLKSLEERGLLSRVHGGALPSLHPHILERQNLRTEEKQHIARAAAALVHNGDTIMLEAGTTVALVCRYLGGKRDIHIITNSALAFAAAKTNSALKITLTGGEFRASTESFVGPIADAAIRRFNVSRVFIGTDGFSVKNGVTTNLVEGSEIIRVMMERAARTVLLTDATKYGKAGDITMMGIGDVDGIITDAGIDPRAVEEIKANENVMEESDEYTRQFWW